MYEPSPVLLAARQSNYWYREDSRHKQLLQIKFAIEANMHLLQV